jgi:translation elongation factor P/translation initiation factor 5A
MEEKIETVYIIKKGEEIVDWTVEDEIANGEKKKGYEIEKREVAFSKLFDTAALFVDIDTNEQIVLSLNYIMIFDPNASLEEIKEKIEEEDSK